MTCRGNGSPTVVLVPGLGAERSTFSALADALADSPRVCTTERAGIGDSPALSADAPDPSAASAAEQLLGALQERDIEAPYVLLGWSYGGLVVQAFVKQYTDEVAGVILEDSSVPEQFTEPFWRRQGIDWSEGGRQIDQNATIHELRDLDFGDLPLFVLTQGDPTGRFRKNWFGHQDRLTALSTNSLHVVADSGHEIHVDALPLVTTAVKEVVESAQQQDALHPCDKRFTRLQGACR